MASGVSPISGSSAAANAANSSSSLTSSAPSESVFLNLLVSQIKNQDPLNPSDSTQFVSQLAQFSELEQVIAIRGDTDQLATSATAAASSGTTTPPATTNP
jgi:flagellar basal-body rod modification protein FlgD